MSSVSNSESYRRVDTPTTILDDYCDYREKMRRNKADSVHDLRRSTVSSALRLPPSTPPNNRPVSRAKSCCAAAQNTHQQGLSVSRLGQSRDDFILFTQSSELPRRPRKGRWLQRLMQWPPQLVAQPVSEWEGDENQTEKRESYALDEVGAVKVLPKAMNVNHHKRVSL